MPDDEKTHSSIKLFHMIKELEQKLINLESKYDSDVHWAHEVNDRIEALEKNDIFRIWNSARAGGKTTLDALIKNAQGIRHIEKEIADLKAFTYNQSDDKYKILNARIERLEQELKEIKYNKELYDQAKLKEQEQKLEKLEYIIYLDEEIQKKEDAETIIEMIVSQCDSNKDKLEALENRYNDLMIAFGSRKATISSIKREIAELKKYSKGVLDSVIEGDQRIKGILRELLEDLEDWAIEPFKIKCQRLLERLGGSNEKPAEHKSINLLSPFTPPTKKESKRYDVVTLAKETAEAIEKEKEPTEEEGDFECPICKKGVMIGYYLHKGCWENLKADLEFLIEGIEDYDDYCKDIRFKNSPSRSEWDYEYKNLLKRYLEEKK